MSFYIMLHIAALTIFVVVPNAAAVSCDMRGKT